MVGRVGPESAPQLSFLSAKREPISTRRASLTEQLNRETYEQIRKVKPSVVSVLTFAPVIDLHSGQITEVPTEVGAGFVVPWKGKDLGEGRVVIATNRHVVESSLTKPGYGLQVQTSEVAPDGSNRQQESFSNVEVLYASPNSDVALIAVDTTSHPEVVLPPVTFGSSNSIQEGYRIAAIGTPHGLDGTVAVGHKARNGLKVIETEFGTYPVFQVDVGLRPGDSGGVIINLEDGTVVGVPDIQINDPSTGLAIPIELFVQELRKAEQLSLAPTQNLPQIPAFSYPA